MVGGKRWIIETPIEQIVWRRVDVPFVDVQIGGDLHPVPLGLVVAEHRRFAFACRHFMKWERNWLANLLVIAWYRDNHVIISQSIGWLLCWPAPDTSNSPEYENLDTAHLTKIVKRIERTRKLSIFVHLIAKRRFVDFEHQPMIKTNNRLTICNHLNHYTKTT